MQTIESCSTCWVFDEDRHRFLRVPRGATVDVATATGWEPYVELRDPDGEEGGFVVVLNEDGTRLLRSTRHLPDCTHCAEPATQELTILDIKAAVGDSVATVG